MTTEEKEPIDPELLEGLEGEPEGAPSLGRRLEHAVGPVLGGLIIDSLDFVTFGTMGMLFGALIGGSVAFYIGGIEELPMWQRVLIAVSAGLYCAFPNTQFIPAATIVGALIRFFATERKRS